MENYSLQHIHKLTNEAHDEPAQLLRAQSKRYLAHITKVRVLHLYARFIHQFQIERGYISKPDLKN